MFDDLLVSEGGNREKYLPLQYLCIVSVNSCPQTLKFIFFDFTITTSRVKHKTNFNIVVLLLNILSKTEKNQWIYKNTTINITCINFYSNIYCNTQTLWKSKNLWHCFFGGFALYRLSWTTPFCSNFILLETHLNYVHMQLEFFRQ